MQSVAVVTVKAFIKRCLHSVSLITCVNVCVYVIFVCMRIQCLLVSIRMNEP